MTAMQWFLGRQERGRVQSRFSAFVFRMTIDTVNQLLGVSYHLNFDDIDQYYSKMFEENNPGFVIDRGVVKEKTNGGS